MKKITKVLVMLALCFCVGTTITLLLLTAVVGPKLKLDRTRVAQIAAIAQGADVAAKSEAKGPLPFEGEQASYQEVVEARAVKYRSLELREQQLRNNLAELQSQATRLADELKRQKQLSDSFNAQLAEVRQSSTSSGMDDLLRTLISIKPEQAKEQITAMLDNKEIDVVVALLKQMPDKKRANIIGEFTTDEDREKLSEVLRRLREGMPEMKAVQKAQAKLENRSFP
jgi:hypothetical protein